MDLHYFISKTRHEMVFTMEPFDPSIGDRQVLSNHACKLGLRLNPAALPLPGALQFYLCSDQAKMVFSRSGYAEFHDIVHFIGPQVFELDDTHSFPSDLKLLR